MQQGFETVTDDIVEHLKQDLPVKAPQIVYRYCKDRAATARDHIRKHYQQFVDCHGNDLVVYPDGNAMAEGEQKFRQYQFDSAPKADVEAFLKRHGLSEPAPTVDWSPDLMDCDNGIGVYFNPDEGQELFTGFNDVVSGFEKRGQALNADDSEGIRQFIYSDAISPPFVDKLVQEYGDTAIAASFLIPRECGDYYLDYLLRRYKGHFYRNRYPSLTVVD
jgi:hypothetical protein